MSLPTNFLAIITALLVTPVLLWMMRRFALRVDFVDVPNARKIHQQPTPLVGGMVLYVMAVLLLLLNHAVDVFSFYLIVASGVLLVVGLLDDLYQLSALWRFVAQIGACLLVIYFADLKLDTFGYLLLPNWDVQLGVMAIPVTIFGVVGVINALNMADGIDGLAAMTFLLPVLALVFLSHNLELSLWLISFLMVVLIFVLFNISKNQKVFLGDNGSLFLGFILAWLLVYFSQGHQSHTAVIKPVTALYLVALPIYDTIFVMLKRIISGHSPFKPDRTHLHHMFLVLGLSQTSALLAMILSQALFIVLGVGFLFVGAPEYFQFYLFVLMSIFYYFGVQKMWHHINSRSV
jgi:UDP-GlcNAc:undecaprenyl-phosphate GlcNAc-1-phosphate transferase